MNNIFFLIPFVLVMFLGIYQDSFAQQVTVGETYTNIKNPDGTAAWSSHHPYVFDGNSWVPYIQNGLTVNSAIGNVKLNANGTYSWNGKFNDRIIGKYADIADLTSWTYPNTLNNDTPDISFSNGVFHSNKIKVGVGNMDYKYVFVNGEWKTELVVTNLSGLTTKVFGFDQIIDLNSDTIKFGGIVRNLDNFDDQTFDKEFLDNNQGKVLDLLNGVNFDFDLGYENLYSITVHDTGVGKSQLVFDYRTSEVLLPGETLIIDPTYTDTPDSEGYNSGGSGAGAACPAYNTSVGTLILEMKSSASSSFDCGYPYFNFDVSAIPNGATVTSASIEYDITLSSAPLNCDWKHLDGTAGANAGTYDASAFDIGSVTDILQNSATCTSGVGDGYIDTFNTGGYASLFEADIDGDNEISLLIAFTSQTRTTGNSLVFRNADAVLSITYSTTPPPDPVDDLTYDNLAANTLDLIWTQPALNGGNLTNYLINYTTPWGDPQTFRGNTTNTYLNVTGLTFGTDYSFRVSALTEGGYNATGNILNITTSSNTYATPPVLTAFGPSSATTQINLEFPSSTMQNINGYRIQRETPIGTGWVTIVSNTTSATQYYNNTGLTSNIIYNYRVYAMNATGLSTVSNEYDMTTFHLPDAVTDLTGTPTDLSTIDLSWSAPESYAPEIQGYRINGTTPTGEPVDILNSNTGTDATTATALNLLIGQEYSFRVSAITVHGLNASGNIWNGSTIQTFVIGNLSNPDITNDDDFSIFFERTDLNASAIQLDVTYPNSYNLSCDFDYKYARINQTYSGLSTVPDGADDQTATFTLINATGDLVQVRCWDVLTGDESTYVITITDFPFLQQINALRDGEYGTFFQIGAFDGVMLIIVFLGMIGLNRTTPIVGITFVVVTTLVMSYFQLITYPVIMYPALIMMIVWAFITTRKDD